MCTARQETQLTMLYTNRNFKSACSLYGIGYSTEELELIIPDVIISIITHLSFISYNKKSQVAMNVQR
jgi:hypothetical protein